MSVITRLATARSRDKKINIYLDGKYTLSLPSDVVTQEGLKTDQELSASRVKSLAAAEKQRRCLNAAVLYLSHRPRSEYEVRQRLQRRGFEGDCIEKIITTLKERGHINDASFACFWKENRDDFSPRSRRMTRMELRCKGIDNELIEGIIGEIDNNENAYRAALIKARRLSPSDYRLFRRTSASTSGARASDMT